MRTTPIVSAAATFAVALAQTPDGFTASQPSTDNYLGVEYDSTVLLPNALLPLDLVQTQPAVFSNTTYSGTYLLLLVDNSIPSSRYPANETASLVPGLGAGTTTRLHWWAGNITQSSADNSFTNSSPALAEYGGPSPPAGRSTPNTYVFYLFPQPADYTPPTLALEGEYVAKSAAARLNFSVEAVAASVGSAPLAANYFRTINPNNTANATTLSGSTGSNVSTSATATPTTYEGAAQKVSMGAGVALVIAGVLAFATL